MDGNGGEEGGNARVGVIGGDVASSKIASSKLE